MALPFLENVTETLPDCAAAKVKNSLCAGEAEVDRDADHATYRLAVFHARIEFPMTRGVLGRAIELPEAAGFLHLHIEHVALRVDGDIQDDRALMLLPQRLDRILGRIAVLVADVG